MEILRERELRESIEKQMVEDQRSRGESPSLCVIELTSALSVMRFDWRIQSIIIKRHGTRWPSILYVQSRNTGFLSDLFFKCIRQII